MGFVQKFLCLGESVRIGDLRQHSLDKFHYLDNLLATCVERGVQSVDLILFALHKTGVNLPFVNIQLQLKKP